MPIRVLIVDDSAFMRRELTRLFEAHADFEVVGSAGNGADGVRKAAELQPDAVTLDVEMPEMSGLQALPMILRSVTPRPKVMMCSSLTKQGSREALQALRLGAADVIAKEGSSITGVPRDPLTGIVPRLRVLFPDHLEHARTVEHKPLMSGPAGVARRIAAKAAQAADTRHVKQTLEAHNQGPFGERRLGELFADNRGYGVVVIGSSTGGPPTLEKLLATVPATSSLPIVIAQHMPAAFTESLSERLGSVCRPQVMHATETCRAEPGKIYVIQGGREGRLRVRGTQLDLVITDASESTLYRPSVDALFESAADCLGNRVAAFQMTGMGQDGLIGAKALREQGAVIACQDRESCVVWGMPRVIFEAGIADASLTPERLGKSLAALAARPHSGRSAA